MAFRITALAEDFESTIPFTLIRCPGIIPDTPSKVPSNKSPLSSLT